ncbi:MAG: hypothetical protein H0X33_14790 [Taibaiella sp.]|nr:hypothetical protein [Taibaiella sp.]
MTRKEFEGCTWREFLLRYAGYQLKRAHEFEHTRVLWHIHVQLNWDSEKKGKCPSMQEMWPLITDEDELVKIEESEKAEYEHLRKIMELAEQNKFYN